MQYLKVWVSFREALTPYSDAEKGRLFDAMLAYAESGEEPHFSGNERFIWATVKQNIDLTRETSEKRRTSGAAGGAANAAAFSEESKPKQTEANASNEEQKEANPVYKSKVKKSKEKEKEIKKTGNARTRANATNPAFEAFWEAYPKKQARQDAIKVWNRMDPDEALTAAIMDGLSRWKRSDQWNRDGDRFIPYAATWLNGSRWEDEVTPYKPRAQVAAQNYSQRTYDDAGADDHTIQRMEQVLALARGGGA